MSVIQRIEGMCPSKTSMVKERDVVLALLYRIDICGVRADHRK